MEFTADKRHAAGGSQQRVVDLRTVICPRKHRIIAFELLDKVLNRKKLACGVSEIARV